MIQMAPPTTKKQLRRFIGMINYYRDMWQHRSDVLTPLTTLSGKTAKWEWTDKHQKAFERIKTILGRQVLLTYPNFNIPFEFTQMQVILNWVQ